MQICITKYLKESYAVIGRYKWKDEKGEKNKEKIQ